jgi:hypothetical protein
MDGSALARWTIRALVAASAACLLAGAVAAVVTLRFVTTAERAEGTVIANAQHLDRAAGDPQRSDVSFRPVVRFTAGSGRAVTFESERGSSPPRYRPGDRVQVRYPAGDPAEARLASFSGQWALPLLLPALALVLLATALLTRQFTQKTWAESQSAA